MSWLRLDANFPGHPKTAGLSDKAFRAYITGLCHCAHYLTDGEIARPIVPSIASKRVRGELVDADLWHERDDAGVDVNDYLEYQRTREEAEEMRRERSEAGRRGGLAKSEAKREAGARNATLAREALKAKQEANAYRNQQADACSPLQAKLQAQNSTEQNSTSSVSESQGFKPSEPDWKPRADVAKLRAAISDRNDETDTVLRHFEALLPPAAFFAASEALQERKQAKDKPPLESEARYVTSLLRDWLKTERYAGAVSSRRGCFVCGDDYTANYDYETTGIRARLIEQQGQWYCDEHLPGERVAGGQTRSA